MKDYVTVKEAVSILGTTRQNIHYLRKHNLIIDFVQVHATCIMYSHAELLRLKSLKKEKSYNYSQSKC